MSIPHLAPHNATDWFTACSIIYIDYMTGTGLDIWTVSYDQCTHTHTHAHMHTHSDCMHVMLGYFTSVCLATCSHAI